MSTTDFVTAFAPASIGNVGVGFDMLGLAIKGAGDSVDVRRSEQPGISILEVRGIDGEIHPFLGTDPQHNTASLAAEALWKVHGDGNGLEMIVRKGVPLQSGMGSSSASAVAAVVAVNALLDDSLDTDDLLPFALEGEKYASGGLHADNVAPSLIGGLVFCPTVLLPRMYNLSVPEGVSSVLVHPEIQVNTADARRGLARGYSLEQWLQQQAYMAGFVAACERNDLELLTHSFHDVMIEPQRKDAVPCFDDVQDAAIGSGAYGCSLSGSGPSMFALCADADAANIATCMEQACRASGYECQSWISPMSSPGAHVEGAA
jgi:homoserine kinase